MSTKSTTKTKTTSVNRRRNTTKRKHRAWIWWIVFLIPIGISIFLFAEPLLDEAKTVLKKNTVIERMESPATERIMERRSSSSRSRPPAAADEKSDADSDTGLGDSTKDDIDWILGHLYKVFPLVLSLIALLKRGRIIGRKD
jgi:hypothetical protein